MAANDDLLDALVRHQVHLLRYGSGLRDKVLALLDKTEQDIRDEIETRWGRITTAGTGGTREARLRKLLETIRTLRKQAISTAYETWRDELRAFIVAERDYYAGATQTVAPVHLDLEMPLASQLRSLVTTHPFQGRVLKDWAQTMYASDLRRIETQLRIGLVQGETTPQLVRRVLGTRALSGSDGITELTRREATSITRTAVNAFSNEARREFSEANTDVITLERYVATLDSRTTPLCASLDGKVYDVGVGPRPPMHFNCRSTRMPVLSRDIAGARPMKQSSERQLLREFAEREGLDRVPGSRSGLPRGTKGAFDQFARRRVREMTGLSPASLSYPEFLRRQSVEFQNEVLGVTRARLFRRGGLTLDRFQDASGHTYTLAELARRDAEAFRRAGLDPADFRG